MTKNNLIVVIFITILFLTGCGRKQKNILSFESEPITQITKLDLPAVKGLKVYQKSNGHLLTWLPLFEQKLNWRLTYLKQHFIGYDVFKLTQLNFIPKHPLNKLPLKEPSFLYQSKRINSKSFYLIQPIFKFNNQIIKGPSSQIVGIKY